MTGAVDVIAADKITADRVSVSARLTEVSKIGVHTYG